MKKIIILFLLVVSIVFAQRPADEMLVSFTTADLVNGALIKASAAVTGSGVANQLTFWNGTTTVGALSTVTYPSLTELAFVKGGTSNFQLQINTKQATLIGSGTGQNIKTINGQTLPGTGNIVIVSDTTGLWLKVYNIVKSLIVGETIIGTKATLDSMIVDFRKNNFLRLNK